MRHLLPSILLSVTACCSAHAADDAVNGTAPAATQAGNPMPSYGQWHSSRFGGGGYIQQVTLCASDPSRAYAHVDVGGVYRSDDGGNSWRMCHGNLPATRSNYSVRGVWVDPQNPDHVVIATGNRWDGRQGIFLSTDGGESWEKTHTAWFFGNGSRRAAGSILVGDPGDNNRLYLAAVNDGFAISNDKGKTWQTNDQLKSLNPTAIWVDPVNTNTIWVTSHRQKLKFEGKETQFDQGLYRSDDHGQTFTQVYDADIAEMLQLPWSDRPLIAIVDRAHLHISHDGGESWEPLEEGLPINEESAQKNSSTSGSSFNAITTGSGFVLLGARNGDIYRLDEGQTSWRHVKPESVNEADWWGRMGPGRWQHYGKAMGSITVDPNDKDHWFTTDWYAVYQSHDAGKTWDLSIDGIEVTVIHTITPDPFDPSLVHIGMADNGYIRSTDRGVNFVKPGGGPSNVKHIVPSRAKEGLIYFVGPKDHEWLANQLYVSENQGKSWSKCKMAGLPDMGDRRSNSIALDPHDPDRLWIAVSGKVASGEGGVYVSNDGGASFTWDSQGMEGSSFFGTSIWQSGPELAVSENGTLLAISASAKSVYTRAADADAWQKADIEMTGYSKPSSAAASVHAPGVLAVALRSQGLYLSSDNGQSFEHVWLGDACYVALDPAMPNRIAVSTSNGIVLSTDFGKTFEPLDNSLPDRVSRLPLNFAGNRLIVGTAGSGIFYIDLPKNQQPLADAPWEDQLNHEVAYLQTAQMRVGVLRYGGTVVDCRRAGQPNLVDSSSATWNQSDNDQPSASPRDRVDYQGHTTWLSPQDRWWRYQTAEPELREKQATWPPDPYLTQLPYEVVEQTSERLVLRSPESAYTGLRFTKTFEVIAPTKLRITTRADNTSSQSMRWGLWSNSRLKPAGDAYVPVDESQDYVVDHVNPWKNPDTAYRFTVDRQAGWLSLTNQTTQPFDSVRDTKLRVDPTRRMIVYRLGDEVLVKQAEEIDTSEIAHGHRSVECYRSESMATPTRELLEVQFHYPEQTVRPGGHLEASETWQLYGVAKLSESGDESHWLKAVSALAGAQR